LDRQVARLSEWAAKAGHLVLRIEAELGSGMNGSSIFAMLLAALFSWDGIAIPAETPYWTLTVLPRLLTGHLPPTGRCASGEGNRADRPTARLEASHTIGVRPSSFY
jgi:hypothetical protein